MTPGTPTRHRRMAIGRSLFVGALFALLLGSPAGADDAALYGPKAPPGSAFVRIFNADRQPLGESIVGTQTIPALAALAASDYVYLPAGRRAIKVGGQRVERELSADTYYTAVHTGDGVRVHELTPPDNRLKALIVLYNHAGDRSLSLRTADGETTIAEAGPGEAATREVNPVKVPMAVFADDRELETVRGVTLERGRAFNLFVAGPADDPQTRWVID